MNIVNNGKHNEMPAQKEKLTEAQIAVLASYVWSLSTHRPRNELSEKAVLCGTAFSHWIFQ